jgi:hypothetical protein
LAHHNWGSSRWSSWLRLLNRLPREFRISPFKKVSIVIIEVVSFRLTETSFMAKLMSWSASFGGSQDKLSKALWKCIFFIDHNLQKLVNVLLWTVARKPNRPALIPVHAWIRTKVAALRIVPSPPMLINMSLWSNSCETKVLYFWWVFFRTTLLKN